MMQDLNKEKKYILGIDTGGTYTDGVLLERFDDTVINKVKANTTREDLSIGIGACISQLDVADKKDEIGLVCLSTTLATNSVVEGKRTRVGLILMYRDPVTQRFTVDKQYQISGRIGIKGEVEEDLNEEEIIRTVKDMKGAVDSLVISGYLSVRNPAHEQRIREIASEILDVPVICAHELSMSLGFFERTVTAVLNAHLLPVIDDLIRKTKKTLEENDIHARLMIVKGDGTMMEERKALERPVETILSGPAASVIGGAALIRETEALFVDIGGTTTDIAYMQDGKVTVSEEGAAIDGWRTKVRSAEIFTFGLGGDSRLQIKEKEGRFGPVKAIPICFAAKQYPYLPEEIGRYHRDKRYVLPGFERWEALKLDKGRIKGDLTAVERKVVGLLDDGPHSAIYIADQLTRIDRITGIEELVQKGIISIISLTPTDLLHVSGDYDAWDADAAKACLEIAAERLGKTMQDARDSLIKGFADQLAFAVMESALRFDGNYDEAFMKQPWIYNRLFSDASKSGFCCQLRKKIVGIGAPAQAWLTRLDERLETEVVVPENYEVANAIGAAKGVLRERLEVLIRHDPTNAIYHIYMPWAAATGENFEEAQSIARREMEKWADEIEAASPEHHYQREWNEEKRFMLPGLTEDFPYEARLILEMTASPGMFRER